MIKDIPSWETIEIGFKEYQLASIEYAPFGWGKIYRYVISREKNPDAQGDQFTGDDLFTTMRGRKRKEKLKTGQKM